MSDLVDALEPFKLEIEAIEDGSIEIDEPLTLGVGAETGVTGLINTALELGKLRLEFDPALVGVAAKLERRLRRLKKEELAGVLRAYRTVGRLYPDILGTGYGGTPEDFEEFRRGTVPEVLRAVAAWAKKAGRGSDARAIEDLAGRWDAAIEENT